jgi:hypothetical protein
MALKNGPAFTPGLFSLLLLVALLVSFIRMLMGRLRMLHRSLCMFFSLRMIALAVMFGGGTMRFSGSLVMLGCLRVLFLGHLICPFLFYSPACIKIDGQSLFLTAYLIRENISHRASLL